MKEILTETINALNNSDLSSYKIAQDTGISDQTIINYRNGTTVPRGNNLKILSKYLGIKGDDKTEIIAVESSGETITMPLVVWNVIQDQAASLKAKDQQMSEVIALLKKEIDKKGEDVDGQRHVAPGAALG